MVTNEDLMKELLQHKALINALLILSCDFARLIECTLERCTSENCNNAATVQHVNLRVKFCDYHAAEAVVNAQKYIREGTSEDAFANSFAEDNFWVDLPNAEQIRRIFTYVNELKKYEQTEFSTNNA